jgi:DNA repair photolyase
MRDIDVLAGRSGVEVGMSITTADERIRKLLEPGAPPITERIKALDALHQSGIETFAMIAPLLPGSEQLPTLLKGKVNRVLLDRLNYHYADRVYKKYHLEALAGEDYFVSTSQKLEKAFGRMGIECHLIH